ncbi:hypothetical protein [Maribellus sediminis]|uniref:hypothetical protein n=1 Tax=Maribellus sediminis TaxID=2696285 RepID=UPI001430960E|nr:hypothetical protein [Maribellus sediminis]
MDRKKFIQTGGRLLLLGGIVAASGYLVMKNRVTASCSVSPTCGNCGKYSKCELPQAEDFKSRKVTP